MSRRVRVLNCSLKLVTAQCPTGNGGDGGDASSGNAIAVSNE